MLFMLEKDPYSFKIFPNQFFLSINSLITQASQHSCILKIPTQVSNRISQENVTPNQKLVIMVKVHWLKWQMAWIWHWNRKKFKIHIKISKQNTYFFLFFKDIIFTAYSRDRIGFLSILFSFIKSTQGKKEWMPSLSFRIVYNINANKK